MPDRAKLTSLEAIQDFRTSLLVFLSKARPTLEEAANEVHRTRGWLDNDRRVFWESQLRRRRRKLEDAEAELFSQRLSKLQQVSMAQQAMVLKARREVEEAEEKLRVIKRWARDFENRTEPLLKQMEKLNNLLAVEVPNGSAYLAEIIDTIQKYADILAPDGSAPPPSAPAETPVELPEKPKEAP